MNRPPRERYSPPPRLTVGDGFRIGFGIACWQVAVTVALFMIFTALGVLGMLLGG
jgi:hypothetical protein